MSVYRLTRYPRTVRLGDGTELTLRPMEQGDAAQLLAFFRAIPAAERALPLLAFDGNRVVADAVLIRHRGGYLQHKAEIRVLVHPEVRQRGLGVLLMRELTDFAWDAELEEVELAVVRDVQDDAIAAAKLVGAFEVGALKDYVKDQQGDLHDLVLLRIPLGKWWQWSQF
jgi:GNAT superfamily N-acetyltransferase